MSTVSSYSKYPRHIGEIQDSQKVNSGTTLPLQKWNFYNL